MTAHDFLLLCFAVGLGFTALAVLGGGHFHLGHMHFGHGHVSRLGHSGASGATRIGPVNGFTAAAFLCWFGGTGYLLERYSGFVVWIVLLLSIASGLVAATALFLFLARVLLPHERVLTVEDTATVGALARVSSPIRADGTGEVQFSQTGARRFAAARSESGRPIPRGVEVVVLRYHAGIAWVLPWEEASGESCTDPTPFTSTHL